MLYVERSNRTERLLDGLAQRLMAGGRDPLAPAVVVVQGAGMERWIAQSMARREGVCANTAFPFPRPFLEDVFGSLSDVGIATGSESLVELGRLAEQWEVRNLTWWVARHLAALRDDPDFAPLARHLQASDGAWRLVQLARQIANLFDQYVTYRPDWLEAWAAGALPEGRDLRWQVRLYRALRADLGIGHMADRASAFIQQATGSPDATLARSLARRFPDAIEIFAVSTLPPLYLSVIDALARIRDVHLSVLSPSRFYWADLWREVRDGQALGATSSGVSSVDDLQSGGLFDLDASPPVAPLLAGLGRLGADFQLCLEDGPTISEGHEDLYVSSVEGVDSPSLLSRLQARLLDLDGAPDGDTEVRRDDDSIRVHRCHGVKREIEIVESTLRDFFERDPTLDPEDVIVMAPDIDAVAPEIEAVFGTLAEDRGGIPFRIADRGALRRSPVADGFCALLALAGGRARRSEIIDWLGHAPVRERFGIDEAGVEWVGDWAARAGIRFGLDAAHRAELDLVPENRHTWSGGLDRLALAHAVGASDVLFDGLTPEPLDPWAEPALLGAVGDVVSILSALEREIAAPRPVAAWCSVLRGLLARTLAQEDANLHEHRAIRSVLDGLEAATTTAGFVEPVPFEAIRERVVDAIESSPPPQAFLSGGVTFCELVPLRAIPFRVVVILGLCDGAFPRGRPAPAFDLMAGDHRPGDRTTRNDDRYLFLEALLSVRDHLVLTVPGRDPRDGAEMPSSVVVSELLDTLDAAFELEPGPGPASRLREHLVVSHPLQSFASANFDPGGDARLRVRDRIAFEGARIHRATLEAGGGHARDFLADLGSLAPPDPSTGVGEARAARTLSIDELVERVLHSTRAFSRVQLGIGLPRPQSVVGDLDPLEFDALDRYGLGTALLDDLLVGASPGQARQRLKANPLVPSGVTGEIAVRELMREAEELARLVRDRRQGPGLPELEIDLAIDRAPGADVEGAPARIRLVGRLDQLFAGGRVVTGFVRLGGWREFDLWIRHLVLCAQIEAGAEALPCSVLVGRGSSEKPLDRVVVFERIDDPHAELARLATWACQAERFPLRFFPRASREYATHAAQGKPEFGRREAYTRFHGGENSFFSDAEIDRNLENALVWEGPSPLEAGGAASLGPSFEEIALRFFEPLDAARKLGVR